MFNSKIIKNLNINILNFRFILKFRIVILVFKRSDIILALRPDQIAPLFRKATGFQLNCYYRGIFRPLF